MKRIYIFCEGKTEEGFVNAVLYDYFFPLSIHVEPKIVTTSKTIAGNFKGGLSNYAKFKTELSVLCKEHKNEKVTTMIDYYGLPNDFPETNYAETDVYKKIDKIEREIERDIRVNNLTVYISLHEFETLLYSDPKAFSSLEKDINSEISGVVNEFGNIELINKNHDTAPSKRIKKFYKEYSKTSDGTKLAKEIGIEKMMRECRHFREWLDKLKNT